MGAQLTIDQPVRDLGDEAGAVTGAVSGPGSSVVQIHQALDGEPGHPVAGYPVQGSDEPDATGIAIRAWIEEGCRHRSLVSRGAIQCKPAKTVAQRSDDAAIGGPFGQLMTIGELEFVWRGISGRTGPGMPQAS